MNESERIARAQRADAAYKEFFEPMLDELRNAYGDRIVEVATTELSRDRRTDKLTALSLAHKIVTTLDEGMKATIADGEMAMRERIKAEKIEMMSAPQRRLLGIAPY